MDVRTWARHWQLTLALFFGIACGVAAHQFADQAWLQTLSSQVFYPVGQIFLRLIFMVVVPMLFSALVLGVCELGQGRSLHMVAGKTLAYTAVFSSFSVLIGIGLVNLFKPGAGFHVDANLLQVDASALQKLRDHSQGAKPLTQILIELIPRNPLDSALRALDGEIVALMVFAVIFGLALSYVMSKERGESTIKNFLEELNKVSMRVVDYAMRLAPFAVFCMVFNTAFKLGGSIFTTLGAFVLVVVAGLLLQQFVVYALTLRLIGGISPWKFFADCREVYFYAFSTASSNATLPKSLALASEKLGIKDQVARFVLTVGATANQNGTALFEGVTVLFLAQVYGINLDWYQQMQVVVMSIIAGIGTAGVPGGSLPLIMIVLQTVGIPPEGIGLILGVDRFLDMCRTALNVSGDLVIAKLVAGEHKGDMLPISNAGGLS